jgi:hypothetical protein
MGGVCFESVSIPSLVRAHRDTADNVAYGMYRLTGVDERESGFARASSRWSRSNSERSAGTSGEISRRDSIRCGSRETLRSSLLMPLGRRSQRARAFPRPGTLAEASRVSPDLGAHAVTLLPFRRRSRCSNLTSCSLHYPLSCY